MDIYKEFMYILIFSILGEMIAKAISLPFPGSVIGMLLLFLSLELKIISLNKIEKVGNFLLANLAILFIPAGVGIMTQFNLIKNIWLSFLLLNVITTVISLILIAKIVEFIKNRFESKGDRNV